MWALLYARVTQTDGSSSRNVLLTRTQLFAPGAGNHPENENARNFYAEGLIPPKTLADTLRRLGLAPDVPLTVLAAEIFTDPVEEDPLGARLGHGRILRISPLAPVPDAC
jgi:hypothetical protein